MKIKKALIPAAGKGSRLFPLTQYTPKEMLLVSRKPVIQYSLERAARCGIELVVVISRAEKRAIEEYFGSSFKLGDWVDGAEEDTEALSRVVRIQYIQQEVQLGLGHAVLTARAIIGNDPFLLMLPDDLFQHGTRETQVMIEIFNRLKGSVLAVKKVSQEDISRFGIISGRALGDGIHEVFDLVEKPQPDASSSDLAIMGNYILEPEIFSHLEETMPGEDGEIQLTDALQSLIRSRKLLAYQFRGEHYDAGTLDGLKKTRDALEINESAAGM